MALAAGALAINLVCVWLLKPAQSHAHDRDGDLNLSAAHLHLAGDAVISALAIAGLAAGRYLGWTWTDPVAALVGRASWPTSPGDCSAAPARCCWTSIPAPSSPRRSAGGWRARVNASWTCISGASAPATTPPSSSSPRLIRRRPGLSRPSGGPGGPKSRNCGSPRPHDGLTGVHGSAFSRSDESRTWAASGLGPVGR
uniref:Cation transporter n=1 Tax=Phenylobacterium glaciei TaxID=2803784 RepID=A0A974P622_9CAUL|nr:cation transporter [Phenylobacterium glaciei]